MTLSATIGSEVVPDIEQDALEVLLLDQARVDAEFAAIMTVSGFGDRIGVAVLTPPLPKLVPLRRERDPVVSANALVSATRTETRVGSPPKWS